MGRRYQDIVLEEQVLRQLEYQHIAEEKSRKERIVRYDERIAILNKQIENPELRDVVKRNLRVWLNAFKNERKQLINNR